MARKKSYITVTDQFCGAGGSSIGAVKAGAELRLAMNHWRLAVETHNTNFPNADHDCTDISACNPRRYPSTDILITSPECTNHSMANGKRKPGRQLDMFIPQGDDPAAERSRATMWDVPRFAEYHGYQTIVVENVVDARKWVMWDAWLHAMQSLGYAHKCVYFNSMHAHPTPQSRDRMYVVFWKRGNRAPDLDIRPAAFCQKCGKDVASVQSWKPGRSFGRYRQQYEYCCPSCGGVVEPYYYAAYNAIDWSLPAPRIGDRARPLKEATLRRVRVGLGKFAGRPFLAVLKDTRAPGERANQPLALTDPLSTQATRSQHALVTPFLVETTFTRAGDDRSSSLMNPMSTQTTQQSKAVVVPPFIVSYYGTNEGANITEPLPTVTTHDRHAVAVPPFLVNMQAHNQPTAMDEPLRTMLTGYHRALVQPTETIKVEDCGFRMLEPHECGAAMAFPPDYKVMGGKRDQVKQYGNAVTPPVMDILMQRCMEALQ